MIMHEYREFVAQQRARTVRLASVGVVVFLILSVAGVMLARTFWPSPSEPAAGTSTPTPTVLPTFTSVPPAAPTSVPAPTEVIAPTEAPTLPPSPVVADFNSCAGVNNLGGPMGAAYNAPNSLTETYVPEQDRGCVARLEYNITEWSAFWIKLQNADLSPYGQLVFDIRADPAPGVPGQMKIELKRASNTEVSIAYVSGITADWQTMSVNLADFGPTGYTAPLSSFTEMEELVFTFEASRSGTQGIVYLDNITLKP